MTDLLSHALRIAAPMSREPTWDAILNDPRARRDLRKAAGRSAVGKLTTKPQAGLYYAVLRLCYAAWDPLPDVCEALGTEDEDTFETLVNLVVRALSPQPQDVVRDLMAVAYRHASAGDDSSAAIRATREFVNRVWDGVSAEILIPAHILLIEQGLGARALDRALVEAEGTNPWQIPPPGWERPDARTPSPPLAKRREKVLVYADGQWVPKKDDDGAVVTAASQEDLLEPTAHDEWSLGDIDVLLEDSVDAKATETQDLCTYAVHFGLTLSDRLAGDIGIVPEGPWVTKVAAVGFCAALPVLAEAFDNDELLSAPVLIGLARRVDRVSGDGDLIEMLAMGNPERLVSESTVRLKSAFTDAGVAVPDSVLALFPLRLAASSEMARELAQRND